MEAQTVLCCSRGLKEIHLLLLFTKFASQLVAELLNATVLYEERGRAGGSGGERRGKGDMEIFLYILRQSLPVRLCQKALFLEQGSKWSILCLAEH